MGSEKPIQAIIEVRVSQRGKRDAGRIEEVEKKTRRRGEGGGHKGRTILKERGKGERGEDQWCRV